MITMTGKTVLITGATSGFGKAAAVKLARLGATVVIGCRTEEDGERALVDIKRQSGSDNLDLFVADLSSQEQIRTAVVGFKKHYNKLDILINNAGVYLPKRQETEDGIEATFAINYLSHFLLTRLLLDLLKRSAPARIINVASKHNGISINFDDLMWKKEYSGVRALGQTKLALVVLTKLLAKQLQGTGVTVNSLHPAIVVTGLGVYKAGGILGLLVKLMKPFLRKTVEEGAETTVYLATSPEVATVSGEFFVSKKVAKTSKNANDAETAKRLWAISEKLTKLEMKN